MILRCQGPAFALLLSVEAVLLGLDAKPYKQARSWTGCQRLLEKLAIWEAFIGSGNLSPLPSPAMTTFGTFSLYIYIYYMCILIIIVKGIIVYTSNQMQWWKFLHHFIKPMLLLCWLQLLFLYFVFTCYIPPGFGGDILTISVTSSVFIFYWFQWFEDHEKLSSRSEMIMYRLLSSLQ